MGAKTLYPDFDDLPKVEGQPQGCAWGLFDKNGAKDIYGTLNFISPETVKAAAAEVEHGVPVSLNWALNAIKFPLGHRQAPVHTPFALPSDMGIKGLHGFDDSLNFNTQYSSQWDSLCHVTHSHSGETYNGFVPTVEKLSSTSTSTKDENEALLPTIDRWHARGGLVARGVLIDWKRYAEEVKGEKSWHPMNGYKITVGNLEEAAKHFGVEFKAGDVLLVRTGMTNVMENPTPEDFAKMAEAKMAGVEGSERTARWVWNKRFAAVAGDSAAFEAFEYSKDTGLELVLHKYLLTMFGMSIGELWDLDGLSEACKKTGKYSFLLTSAPLNHPGLVASPPNATAVL
ncbi:hypothetical protein QBC32DRAFT_245747 [Pseudoneurospora amorphoporcata]|uniref:Cyclase n=1 Tax=Pseudoneurospora amorphoporcata TaxID=241081 RepID=A0AAN6NRF5_9PEZI|nr:hypothetical protein QBC32DRAFT_245747 [Pseudoneurospora amorphoporcata]